MLSEKYPQYSIRLTTSWGGIHQRLQDARVQFDGSKSEFLGKVKKTYRWLADMGSEASDLVSKAPDMEYVSAVKAVVEVLLQAAKTASYARHTITGMFDSEDLDRLFAKVEVFLATFPDDENIIDRSIELVACILKAVEGTIVYFLTNTFKRGAQSMPLIGKGQQPLLDAITEIQTRSQRLIDEATMSHFAATRNAMELILEDISKIELLEIETAGRIEYIIQRRNDQILGGISELKDSSSQQGDKMNEMLSMLIDGARKHEEEAKQYQMMFVEMKEEIKHLRVMVQASEESEKATMRATEAPAQLPAPQAQQVLWYPPQPPQWQSPPPPPQYCYQPHVQSAQHWPPRPAAPPGPLPYYTYAAAQQPPVIPTSTLLAVLNISGLDKTYIEAVLELEGSVPPTYRNNARQIVAASQFGAWATTPGSRKLLIQGDPQRDAAQAGLALSLMSASLVRALRAQNQQERIISLVFFCRQHVESNDPTGTAGAAAVLRSLVAQLLQQHYADATFRPEDVDVGRLAGGELTELCRLFGFLVRHITAHKTLVCVLDGLGAYDTASYEVDMRTVLDCLLGDLDECVSGPAVKILATTVGGTSFDRVFGEEDENFLVLQGLTRMGEDAAMLEFEGEL
ncbi:hypothetical protein C8A03DRAFT_38588 [Achaetomium macrosporum]|uniref:Nephrocystin 3-like N-terminal domain-containing protein n=1 Tax=Achaetomium macrosporum TaxID=79813 RepID=A0AAN7C1R9_9PEZI|nr:hypothetical protein C8A03DRAFT_38588 [Achaetomium macrosporum]